MSAIDLIPSSYHSRLRARRMLRRLGVALFLLVATAIAAAVIIQWQLRLEAQQLSPLLQATARSAALRAQVDSMTQRKQQLMQTVAAEAALRGRGGAALALQGLDQALNEGIWLSSFRFAHTHRQLAPPASLRPGTLPASGNAQSGEGEKDNATIIRLNLQEGKARKEQTWHFSSRIELRGSATDHAALADFLQSLSLQPGIASTRLLKSHTGNGADAGPVEFDLDAAVLPKGVAG